MTLPVTAPITLGQVLTELRTTNPGRALPISLGDADVRALAGIASGPISMTNLLGKSSYIPMTLTGFPASNSADSTTSGGTVACSPAITISGGSGGYTVSWAFVTPDGCTLVGGNSLSCTVSHTYVKTSIGGANATVRATVTDNTGHTQTIDVTATLDWGF